MMTEESSKSLRVNKLALVLLIVVATAVGFFPFTLTIDRLNLLIVFMMSALVLATITMQSFKTVATEAPSLLEFIFGGLSGVYNMALAGSGLLIIYWIYILGINFFEFLVNLFGFKIQLNAELIAFYLSFVGAIVGSIYFIRISTVTLAQQLYPNIAGMKSAYYELTTHNPKRLIITTAITLLFPCGLFSLIILTNRAYSTWWFNYGLYMYLILVSSSFSKIGRQKTITPQLEDAVHAIGKLYDAMGYRVIPSPRTGRSEIDPLLLSLDIYVQGEESAFAIKVIYFGDSHLPLNTDLLLPMNTDLLLPMNTDNFVSAVWALESYLKEEPDPINLDVSPIIISIGEMSDVLKTVYSKDAIEIIEISESEVVSKILSIDNEEKLREMASLYLGINANRKNESIMNYNPNS